jgi:hypothetical protein
MRAYGPFAVFHIWCLVTAMFGGCSWTGVRLSFILCSGSKGIPGADPRDEEDTIPLWASKVHPSHRVLKYAGGMVMRAACSSISSSQGGNSRLWKFCQGKIAEGSLPRYRKFLAGFHPHFPSDWAHQWPSGAATAEPQRVHTAKRHVDGSLLKAVNVKAAKMILPQRGYTYVFTPNVVTFQQQQVINGILEGCLERSR